MVVTSNKNEISQLRKPKHVDQVLQFDGTRPGIEYSRTKDVTRGRDKVTWVVGIPTGATAPQLIATYATRFVHVFKIHPV